MYEQGRITRATECAVALSSSGTVTGRTVVNGISYSYDEEGRLTGKRILGEDGQVMEYGYSRQENESGNPVSSFRMDGRTIVSHSKIDQFGRKAFDELQLGKGFLSRQFHYHVGTPTAAHLDNSKLKSSPTTEPVKSIVFANGRTLTYEYDGEERLTKGSDSAGCVTEYTYDARGQLLTEVRDGETVNAMTYDAYGNLLTKNGVSYGYENTVWKDLATSVGGQSITYDAGGNPVSYRGHTLVWEKGRQLNSFGSSTYAYNANGIRTEKMVGGVKHRYHLDGAKLVRETWGNSTLTPLYDNEEALCGIVYNGTAYYFYKNLQGDIVEITDGAGGTVARYAYDAWGVCRIEEDTSGKGIASVNPFRYRGLLLRQRDRVLLNRYSLL